jgi:hypothetical protein
VVSEFCFLAAYTLSLVCFSIRTTKKVKQQTDNFFFFIKNQTTTNSLHLPIQKLKNRYGFSILDLKKRSVSLSTKYM